MEVRANRPPTAKPGDERVISQRQFQVLELVAEGQSDKEVAVSLGISVATVKTYLARFYRYHGLKNRAQAVGFFTKLGLVALTERRDLGRRLLPTDIAPAGWVTAATATAQFRDTAHRRW
jgi:DNA-binding CsgD family transcriptional regulator